MKTKSSGTSRPTSAISQSTRPASSMKGNTMRESFYSSEHKEKDIYDSFKLANIIDLTPAEQQILTDIKQKMEEEAQILA